MKKIFAVAAVVITIFFAVFTGKLHDGVSSAAVVTALNQSNQSRPLTRVPLTANNDIVPLSGQSNMLQFTAGGHVLGFQPTKDYLASLDHALSVEFLNTKGVMPEATESMPTANTQTKAPALKKVRYKDLWKGISLTYESTQDGITESTYQIGPGADVSQIRLRYNVPVSLEKDGSLKFAFERGYLSESKPIAWQDINGSHAPVTVAFRVSDDNTVSFSLGAYNPHEPVIIDPTYQWHTFYGAADSNDFGNAIAIDTSGNVYIAGVSYASWGLPLNPHGGNGDLFVLKLNSSGIYQWHTFYGSASLDFGTGIVVDTVGNVYVTGASYTAWGSPLHAYSGGDNDLFVLKLNSDGVYQWHTFHGGNGGDYGSKIAVDNNGNVYVTGESSGSWGLPLNAYSGYGDLFVLKLNSDGAYQWHTFYGSSNSAEGGRDITVDTSGNVYVTGYSGATWGLPLNPHGGNGDVFVLKLNSSGIYQWHTFYGSNNYDYGYGIAVDTSGNVYVTGYSFATWGSPLHNHNGSGLPDLFVLKLNSEGAYQWHTFYGSWDDDYGRGITVDSNGNVYITGDSWATWGSPLNLYNDHADLFVLKLNNEGAYQWHTFFGSNNYYYGYGIAVDTSGNIHVTGESSGSWGIPLNAYSGYSDLFVLKLNDPSVKSDFNSDGHPDILWRNTSTGENTVWFMNGLNLLGYGILGTVNDQTWQIAGIADFDSDEKTDILWRHTSGWNVIWLMDGTTVKSSVTINTVTDTNWVIKGAGDFDGDGKPDILWKHNTGWYALWYMNGTTLLSGAYLPTLVSDPTWAVVGLGDFNSDGKTDLLWRHSTTGMNIIWFMNGTTITSSVAINTVTDPNWQIVGTSDLNMDGKTDILWRHSTGWYAVWYMDGSTLLSGAYLPAMMSDPNWQIVGR